MYFKRENKYSQTRTELESTLAKDSNASPGDNALINRLNPEDFQGRQSVHSTNKETDNHQLEGNGILPTTRVTDSKVVPQDVLTNPQATAQDKLRALATLGRSGVESLTITDGDGTKRHCRVELEQCGKKTLVHLFAQDKNGKERVILRGVENQDGMFSHEIGKDGREVSFTGTWWSKHMKGSSLGVADESTNVKPQLKHKQSNQPGNKPPLEHEQLHQSGDKAISQQHKFNPDVSNIGSQIEWNHYFDQLAETAIHTGTRPRMEKLKGGCVYIRAGMTIDADGAPDATAIDPDGKSVTSLRHPDGSSVNAREIPYYVLPLKRYQRYGIHKGDLAAVRYNGKVEFAVFADEGPSHKLGEGSMALAQALGINHSPTKGGVSHGVEYLVFPRSGDGTPGTPHKNKHLGSRWLSGHAELLSGSLRV